MSYQPQNILVTGGAGFIGANFVHFWLQKYPGSRVVVLDALTYAGNRASLQAAEAQPNFRFVHGDIREYDLVSGLLREEGIDTIVHFAAESHVDRSIHGPDEFISTNVIGTHVLLKAAKAVWLDNGPCPHRFHHVSTDEVYGTLTADAPPFTEHNQYAPNSPYAASKAASDHLVRAYHETYGLEVTTSNCSNNYGPYQFPEKLIPLIITNILDGRPLPIYGDGLQIRDWLYVDDHNRGIDLVVRQGRPGETYNIGGNNEWKNIDLINLLCELMDEKLGRPGGESASLITFVKDRAGHDKRYAIDSSRISNELGWTPAHNFRQGLSKTIDWYLQNEEWMTNVLSGDYEKYYEEQYLKR